MATLTQPISSAINKAPAPQSDQTKEQQTRLEARLVAVTLAAILLSLFAEQAGAPAWLVLIFNITAYVAGGLFGLKNALTSLLKRRIDVDMLMILAAVGAALIDQWREGALLLFLFSLSNVLQDYAIGRSRQAIKGLMKLYPAEAKVKRAGGVEVIPVSGIHTGDIMLIEPGERIPVDGVVRAGHSTLDQAPITGESMPVEKTIGDKVFAGTLNQQGALDVEATGVAADTVLARIIKMVEEAQDTKAPTERFLENFEQIYAIVILVSVGLFIVIPPTLGWVDFTTNFYRAMVLMTVASPCALVISTPASFISAIASAARGGVLFKGGAYLEGLATIKGITFDKTGTLTQGKPTVTDVITVDGLSEDDFLTTAAAIEARSEHPIAKAIVNEGARRQLPVAAVEDFKALPGRGIEARVDGQTLHVGSINHLRTISPLPDELETAYERIENEGKTVIGIIRDEAGALRWLGIVGVADQLRPEARDIVATLHKMGVQVAMLTGDNTRVAHHIASQVGIERIYADLMPEDKVKIVKQLEAELGAIAMVGDGVNDAPALATATIGIAMGAAGTDVALETADLVLMGDRLELIPYAIGLSKKARRVVWQNISFSLAVIVVLILGAFFIDLPLPLGVLAHEGSTVIVVLNGLIVLLLLPELARMRKNRAAHAQD